MSQNGVHLPQLRSVLIWYALLCMLMIVLGLLAFMHKNALDPALVLEEMLGSAVMLQHYPDAPDGFRNARSFAGMLKIVWPHCLAFSLFGFILLHLIAALHGPGPGIGRARFVFYGLAVLELSVPALFYALPPVVAAYLRLTILLSFTAVALGLAGWLLALCLISSRRTDP